MPQAITSQIVNIIAKVTAAPTPSQLQQSGAFLSFGGTILTVGQPQFCATLSQVQSLLSSEGNYAELNNQATTFFAQGNGVGVYLLELGNIQEQVLSVTVTDGGTDYATAPTVTFSAPGSGGTTATGTANLTEGVVTSITITNPGSGYASAPTVSFSGGGGTGAAGTVNLKGIDDEIAALANWITNNSNTLYAYLCPSNWDYSKDTVGSVIITNGGSGYTVAPSVTFSAPSIGITATGTAVIQNGAVISVIITNPGEGYESAPTVTFGAPESGTTATGTANLSSAIDELASNYANPTGLTYFFVTTTTETITNYQPLKSLVTMVKAPTAPSTEFSLAAAFYQWLVNNPNASNRLAPMAYRYLYGVTPWIRSQNQITINTVLSDYGNIVLTGAEGGISNTLLRNGTTMDGSQANWWYGVDWFIIQSQQALSAAIINGSNSNPPLYYDQAGINTLQKIAQNVLSNGVAFGCLLSGTVSAIPFSTYTQQNPDDYNAGIYNGLSATIVGQNGFLTITFYIDALQFVPTSLA